VNDEVHGLSSCANSCSPHGAQRNAGMVSPAARSFPDFAKARRRRA
jgi:hypothetical protein